MASFADTIKVDIDIASDKATSALGGVKGNVADAEGSFGKLKATAGGVFDTLKVAGPLALAAAGTAVAGFAVDAIGSFQDAAQEVLHFKTIAGGTAEDASRWIAAFDDYGVSADQASTLVGKLAKSAETSPEKLGQYGAAVATAKDGTLDLNGTLLNVIDALNNAPDAGTRAALGTAAFGKGWQDMSKLIDAGAMTVKEAFDSVSGGQIFSEKDLQNSEKFRLALDDVGDAVEGLQNAIGSKAIPILADLIKLMSTLGDVADTIPDPIRKIGEEIVRWNPITGPLVHAKEALEAIAGAGEADVVVVHTLNTATGELKGTIEDEAATEKLAAQAVIDHGKALSDAAQFMRTMDADARHTASAFDTAATAASTLHTALDEMVGVSLSLDEATDQAIESQQKIVDAFKENGATLDENTEKGRANRESIRGSITDELAYVDAFIKGGGTVADATLKVEQYRQGLITQMVQSGLSQEAAEAYVAQLGLTPEKVETAIQLANLEQAKADAQAWIDKLTGADPNGIPKETQTVIQALIDEGSIAEANLRLEALAITRTVYYNAVVNGGDFVAPGAGLSTGATGGFRSGMVLVGEQGPELVNLPGGSYINTASQSAAMMKGGGGSTFAPVINVSAGMGADGQDIATTVINALKAWTRSNGALPLPTR